jgi:uncharacterized protein YdeI (YjbR/CyaY-like superfamily)
MNDPTLTFDTHEAWEAWLDQHGGSCTGVWLRLAKKSADTPTVSYAQALEIALCYGWIDGRKQAEDAHYWLQRFSPRAARSLWSEVNRKKALALIAAGRMRPAGLQQVERAKADGRWDAAYAPASTATVPEDLQRALDAHPQAKAFFATLNSRNRYAILFRVHNAKKPETRARKIVQFVDMLSRGEALYP